MLRIALLALASVTIAQPALAEKGGNGRGHGSEVEIEIEHEHEYEHGPEARRGSDDHARGGILISREDREIIYGFLREERAKNCPPGLAKKNNGCLPPGQAKKYRIGHPLGDDVKYRDLPQRLLDLLGPAGKDRKYVMVNEEVLLIAEGTQLVLDAIDLLNRE
ncbi:MAG: hypothetical protein EOM26_13030 [Alphaproteobacteria bacterium]|nr:hypothetical protein [Alphaproteobacteria bacterium]